jgi:Ca2+-binding RTX toxin-like protein
MVRSPVGASPSVPAGRAHQLGRVSTRLRRSRAPRFHRAYLGCVGRRRYNDDQVIGNAGSDRLFGGGGDDTVDSRDTINANGALDGGTHVAGDKKVTDSTEKSIVGFRGSHLISAQDIHPRTFVVGIDCATDGIYSIISVGSDRVSGAIGEKYMTRYEPANSLPCSSASWSSLSR